MAIVVSSNADGVMNAANNGDIKQCGVFEVVRNKYIGRLYVTMTYVAALKKKAGTSHVVDYAADLGAGNVGESLFEFCAWGSTHEEVEPVPQKHPLRRLG